MSPLWREALPILRTMGAAAVVLIVIWTGRAVWESSGESAAAMVVPGYVSPARVAGQPADVYIDGIMRRNLFDISTLESWNPTQATAVVVESLDVTLVGTVVADSAEFSTAFVRHDDGVIRFYGHNDLLLGHRIMQISPRTVTLIATDGTWSVLHTNGEGARPRNTKAKAPSADPTTLSEQLGTNHIRISATLLRDVDLQRVAREGGLQTKLSATGEPLGVVVSNMRPGSLFDHMGLLDGDLLVEVDDIMFDDLADANRRIRRLEEKSDFCSRVERGGTPMMVCYDVK